MPGSTGSMVVVSGVVQVPLVTGSPAPARRRRAMTSSFDGTRVSRPGRPASAPSTARLSLEETLGFADQPRGWGALVERVREHQTFDSCRGNPGATYLS